MNERRSIHDSGQGPPPQNVPGPPALPKAVVVTRRPQASSRGARLYVKARTNVGGLLRLDLTLLGSALALSLIGALLVWSATRTRLLAADDDPNAFVTKHMVNLVVGLSLGYIVTRIDYRILRAWTPIVYGFVICTLLVVLSPFGTTINGANAWIALPGGFTIQPGELAKIVVILSMATVLSERDVGRDMPTNNDVRNALVWAAGPVFLIMLQPDLGTVIIIGAIVIGIIAVSNAPTRWVIGLLAAVVVVAIAAISLGVLDQYQLDRLLAFLDPGHDPQGSGYNTAQARIAIGGGGLLGQGLFHGNQTQGAFVPYQQTDFVFSVAAEELGLVGAGLVILLVGLVVWRGIKIARAARDPFGRLVATGVVCWFTFQAFENIGMNLGIMPVTGVPLPFVSYGGTSMFAGWIGVGLLQSVHLRSRE
ncbi:MAG: rod shape-determining protein RodA [Actinomycetes bacterium]